VATLELQSRFFMSPKAGSFQGIAFVDAAALNREELRDVGQLASAGLGLRWRYEEHLSAKLDYGIPIDFPEDESGDPLLHFSLGVTW
jgi:hemolysin activation/secretion protein